MRHMMAFWFQRASLKALTLTLPNTHYLSASASDAKASMNFFGQ
jgi:hypothetical protein